MTAEALLARELADKLADDRAHRLASISAESLIRSIGLPAPWGDEYVVHAAELDEFARDCIAHLVFHGLAVTAESAEVADGAVSVSFVG